MAVAVTLQDYLDNIGVDYEVVAHPYTETGLDTAESAHIPADKLAKSIILEDEGGYLMAVCPASRRIKLGELYREINRRLEFANESEPWERFSAIARSARYRPSVTSTISMWWLIRSCSCSPMSISKRVIMKS